MLKNWIHVCFNFFSLCLKGHRQQITASSDNPRRRECGKKSHSTYMKRLKEKILENNQLPTSSPTEWPTPSTPSFTGNSRPSTSFSTNTYVYGVSILAVLVIGVFLFFTYNKKVGQIIHEQPIKPKQSHML